MPEIHSKYKLTHQDETAPACPPTCPPAKPEAKKKAIKKPATGDK
jgi:hypothetical protein|tara:strand:- start:390 stop:524 length:135 start_codon:yes stop_codon:yes gene_type:complete